MAADHEIVEFELRLHRVGRPWPWDPDNPDAKPDDWDWDQTAVGSASRFPAQVVHNRGLWHAVTKGAVLAPEGLASPAWSIRQVGKPGPPLTVGDVNRALEAGETFEIPVSDGWTATASRLDRRN